MAGSKGIFSSPDPNLAHILQPGLQSHRAQKRDSILIPTNKTNLHKATEGSQQA